MKMKIKLLSGGLTSIFLEIYPARNPEIVFERPDNPKTPSEKASWMRPQIVPKQAPTISPLANAK